MDEQIYEEKEIPLKEEQTLNSNKKSEQPMGDVYDVYAKTVGVHSSISGMSEDYTLARYDIDIYNEKTPKFIREQRKILRILKSIMILPKETLKKFYNNEEKAEYVYNGLVAQYDSIQELLLGELDECVIMSRTPKGEVINALLKHGLNKGGQEEYDIEQTSPNVTDKLKERG